MKIALVGNPNSGKTTLFNDLTGSSQYVGNWPGVTVEKKEGRLKGADGVIIQDLPGIYSLSPYTPEEVIARNYLVNEKPDAVINVVDATNLERNLYLTTQVAELGIPMVIALNMIDVTRKNGDVISLSKLGEALGCEVVETSALKGIGTLEVAKKAVELCKEKKSKEAPHVFMGSVEHALAHIEDMISHVEYDADGNKTAHHHHEDGSVHEGVIVEPTLSRWYAIKLFERDEKALAELKLDTGIAKGVEESVRACEQEMDDDSESIIINQRYAYISQLINSSMKRGKPKGALSLSDKIDRIVTNRILGLPIFAFVMFLVYYVSISTVGTMGTDWANDVLFGEWIPNAIGGLLESLGTAEWLSGLILDGIVAGVGAVLGFLPQMLVLFLCLALLEDCGYMARIAFVMDRVFRKFGLSGKSFIPMLVSTGCGVPGIMASRTIENDNDRRMTVMTTTFVPCGAKLPIIALIAGALFNDAAWVATSAYFIGVAAIVISGIMLKKTKMFASDPSPFIMELPAYHAPRISGVLRTTLTRGGAFIKKATTIVLLATVLIWFLSTFSWSLEMVDADASMLASVGNVLAPLFAPLGWGDWRPAVATITGLMAKENVVGTFGILYGFEEVAENGMEYWDVLKIAFSQLSAYSFLVFNLLCAPCFAAIGALRREMMSAKWTLFAVGYQCAFAYAVALIQFQLGTLFTGGGFGFGTVFALATLALMIYMLVRKPSYTTLGK